MAVRALCRDGVHGGNPGAYASVRRRTRAALSRAHARAARSGRRADRPRAVGGGRHRRRRQSGPLVAASAREIRRHQQSRLLSHQVRRLGPGGTDPLTSDHRYRASARERLMPHVGLVLLLLVGLGIVLTGLPAAIVLIGVASAGAAFGVLTDTIPLALLSALPGRLVNLFENDLLQALPL